MALRALVWYNRGMSKVRVTPRDYYLPKGKVYYQATIVPDDGTVMLIGAIADGDTKEEAVENLRIKMEEFRGKAKREAELESQAEEIEVDWLIEENRAAYLYRWRVDPGEGNTIL